MKKLILLLASLSLLVSCTKEITIDLPEVKQKIVVDGGIVTGEYAVVTLTWSAGYFDPVDSAALSNSIISNALVIMSDGIQTDTLQPQIDFNYIIPLVYKGSVITGQVGRTYSITITAGDQTVTSSTTIPNPIPLDSAWFEVEPDRDSLGFMWARMTDPNATGNGYRWFTKRIGEDSRYLPPFGSAFDDQFINGTSFDFAFNRPRSSDPNAPEDETERGYFKIGDVVAIRFTAIGQNEVNFFRTYETELSNNGNPFAAPGVVDSNIEGGLGIWCGYSASQDTVTCQ
ncbi:MAG: DUF4249 domain-containing protein [Bacteroidia bacterium]